ncbi:MAG: hypothetical protein V3R64_04260 [Sphingomonadales bacterium]
MIAPGLADPVDLAAGHLGLAGFAAGRLGLVVALVFVVDRRDLVLAVAPDFAPADRDFQVFVVESFFTPKFSSYFNSITPTKELQKPSMAHVLFKVKP